MTTEDRELSTRDLNTEHTPLQTGDPPSIEDMETSVDYGMTIAPDLLPEEQRRHIKQLIFKPKVLGETWYIVANSWFLQWQQHCENDKSESFSGPGPIDNSSILEDGKLTKEMISGDHFVLVPEEAWICLAQWYGCKTTALPRQVVDMDGAPEVDLDPYVFTLHITAPITEDQLDLPRVAPVVTLSHHATTNQLKDVVRAAFGMSSAAEFQLWTLNQTPTMEQSVYVSLSSLRDASISDLSADNALISDIFQTSDHIAVELPDPVSRAYPSEAGATSSVSDVSSTTSTSSAIANSFKDLTASSDSALYSSQSVTNHESGTPRAVLPDPSLIEGVCGLENLGNTCFMNSAVQCLSNTPQLSKWFLAGNCEKELNKDNPLGMKGQIAETFGELVEKLWSRTSKSIRPQKLKETIGRFNKSFVGYRQHDSQELLSFLLDGLHEDLNRILKKPYIELPDFEGVQDEEIAQRSWGIYKARNDSIIVDLFQGQFKSRLTCGECSKVSTTFDPFMYLSLPLPIDKKRKTKVTYVPFDPTMKPVSLVVTLNKNASIDHLRSEVAREVGADDPSKLLVVKLFHRQFFSLYAHYEPVTSIGQTDEVCIYELPGPMPREPGLSEREEDDSDGDELIVFPIYCATLPEPGEEGSSSGSGPTISRARPVQFGKPMLMAVKRADAETVDAIYNLIAHHIERYAIVKLCEEVGEATPNEELSADDNIPLAQKPIHTAAAVTAAGGRRMQPMPNLFTMKVFSDANDLIPLSSPLWNYGRHVDLRERAARESERREPDNGDITMKDDQEEQDTNEMMITPSESQEEGYEDEDEDDIVEDAAASYDADVSSSIVTLPERTPTPKDSASNDRPQSRTVIRQGEGIIIEWRLKKAQQVFGMSKDGESVDSGGAWEDIEDRGDPNAEEDSVPEKQVTLDDCLDEFTREEQLSGTDLWYCPSCKKHQPASKKFDLWRLPEIMVVHLKRFSHSRTWRDKIDALIDFPLEGLDLTDRVLNVDLAQRASEERFVYDLYAVDNHFGGLGGGHYTAYAQNWATGNWYDFNDSRVEKIEEPEKVKTSAAYLLFYKRRRPVQQDRETVPDNEPNTDAIEIDNIADEPTTSMES